MNREWLSNRAKQLGDFWLAAVVSYVLFGDEAAGDAAVLATLTAIDQDRKNMMAILLLFAVAEDLFMLMLMTADTTKSVCERPLPEMAATIRERAKGIIGRVRSSGDGLVSLILMRRRLHKKSPAYELALGGATRPDGAVFSRLDPNALERLMTFCAASLED
jgi:hypothetical protein